MSDPKLSNEEKQILEDFEAGEFKSILTPKRKKMLQAAAEETFKKDKRINIRILLVPTLPRGNAYRLFCKRPIDPESAWHYFQ